VQRATVVRSDDRDRAQPERARRAEDAQRNLAAVRYEELLQDARIIGYGVRAAPPA
jgi:hypothetical protein